MLTLTNTNSNIGLTTLSGGTLQLGNGAPGNDGTLNGNLLLNNNSVLLLNDVGAVTYPVRSAAPVRWSSSAPTWRP